MEDSIHVRESRYSEIRSELGNFASFGYPEMSFHGGYEANFADPALPLSIQTPLASVGRRHEETRGREEIHEGRKQSAFWNELVLEKRRNEEIHDRTRQSAVMMECFSLSTQFKNLFPSLNLDRI